MCSWVHVTSQQGRTNDALLINQSEGIVEGSTNDRTSVAAVMAIAKSNDVRNYDEIATRICAASPFMGATPLCTLARETQTLLGQEDLKRERLKELREGARPLSFELDLSAGHVAYEYTHEQMRLLVHRDGQTIERRLSLAHPPSHFYEFSTPDPAPRLIGQQVQIDDERTDIWWLPFPALVEQGRFVRMQTCNRLVQRPESKAFYLFVSHRWLDLADPDPQGAQAAAVAWQLVAEVVEAIWVCAARGNPGMRLRSAAGHVHIGPTGSEVAESIVVNLLASVGEHAVGDLVRQAELFNDIEADRGVRQASQDTGLKTLRARIAKTPAIQELLSRVWLWYDFNCMPQHPRTPLEQERFEAMLRQQGLIQMMGRTTVLLDDIADYFGRGWCSYEAALAGEYLGDALDVWAGSRSPMSYPRAAKDAFMRVLHDRPHLVWRAILDTELFGLQTPEECMARLGLDTTRPEDGGIVYGLLRALGVPKSIRYDPGEVLSGVFPIPVIGGQAVVVSESARRFTKLRNSEMREVATASLVEPFPSLGPVGLPAWHDFPHKSDDQRAATYSRTAHVAVVASCEGEAILFAHWVHEHRETLQSALQVHVVSLSWLASDIAPVGHFALGALSIRPVECDSWIVVATSNSLAAGYFTNILVETLWCAGVDHAELEIDAIEANLKVYAKGDATAREKADLKGLRRFDVDDPILAKAGGALFRPQLTELLGIQTAALP